MKKTVLAITALSVAAHAWLSFQPPPEPVEQPWASGGTTVTLSGDGTLRVSGNGAMEDYDYRYYLGSRSPWERAVYHKTAPPITSVVIEEGVTHIGDYAFAGIFPLASVTIPNSVTSIGKGAFLRSGALYDKFTPYNTSVIGNGFSVIIPNGVTSIGERAFYESGLVSVTIPNSVTSIEHGAFHSCTGLTSIAIPGSVASIGVYAFAGSGLTSVTIEPGITEITAGAFSHCLNLTSFAIPNSVTKIGEYAFHQSGLTSVTIPGNVAYIGRQAFAESALKSVTVKNGVRVIDAEAFRYCGSLTSVKLPNSVEGIGYAAFERCSSLTSISLPSRLTVIGPKMFLGCRRLASVTVRNPVPPQIRFDIFYDVDMDKARLYVPAISYFAYRAAGGWNDFRHVRVFASLYDVIALCILAAAIWSAAVIMKSRKIPLSRLNFAPFLWRAVRRAGVGLRNAARRKPVRVWTSVSAAALAAWVAVALRAPEDATSFVDRRDGKRYAAVTIGGQTWTASNMNYKAADSRCYDNGPSDCAKYGRLYNWYDAMSACPAGWHLPTGAEWETLFAAVGGVKDSFRIGLRYDVIWPAAGTRLKSKTDWKISHRALAGTDDFGFTALPGGSGTDAGGSDLYSKGHWWSSTVDSGDKAVKMMLHYDYGYATMFADDKKYLLSVRCVKDGGLGR